MEREERQKRVRGVKFGGLRGGGAETRAQVIFYLIVEEERMGRVSQQGDQRQTEGDRDGEAEMQRGAKTDSSLPETS